MDVVVYDEQDRRYVPVALVLLVIALVALLGAGVGALLGRTTAEGTTVAATSVAPPQSTSDDQAGTAPSATPAGDCGAALTRGDAVVARAERLNQALAQHTEVLDDLLADRADADAVVDRSLPILTEAATDRERYADELAAYQSARKACRAGSG